MQIEVGSILEGKVTGITKFGAFVDLGEGKSGMVHISEISTTYVENVSDFLSVGQTVTVKVLSIADNGKISLSIKKAVDNGTASGRQGGRDSRDNNRRRSGRPDSKGGEGREDKRGDHQSVKSSGSPGDFVWQKSAAPSSFEDMMTKFKQQSDEKISTLKKGNEYTIRRPRRKG